MQIEEDDFKRLAFEVSRFLSKGDLKTRLATQAKLYLEFPDVGSMHHAHRAIVNAMGPSWYSANKEPWTYIDDHTVLLEPYAGVCVVLTCVQRFAVKAGGSVGYRDIVFTTKEDYEKRLKK